MRSLGDDMILDPCRRSQVLPLPVVLISTISKEGVRNAAPWGCVTPILRPLDEILIVSWIKRDTLDNIRQTGEFVVNVPSIDMVEEVTTCAKPFPPQVDEFDEAKLIPRPSTKVKPPGIEGCLSWMECTLSEEILREKFSLIIGKVVHLEVDDRFFNEMGEMDLEKAKPMCMIVEQRYTYPMDSKLSQKYSEMFLKKDDLARFESQTK